MRGLKRRQSLQRWAVRTFAIIAECLPNDFWAGYSATEGVQVVECRTIVGIDKPCEGLEEL